MRERNYERNFRRRKGTVALVSLLIFIMFISTVISVGGI